MNARVRPSPLVRLILPLAAFGLLAVVVARPAAQQRAGGGPAPMQIFLLIGQSNMAGRGAVEDADRVAHPRVWMFDRSGTWVPAVEPMHFDKPAIVGVGPGRAFAITLAEEAATMRVGLVPAAVGGSPIDAWRPGAYYKPTKSHPWDDAMRRAKAAMQAGTLAGILWHQGESDATAALADDYASKLDDLVGRLRGELGAPDVPFIAGQMGRFSERPWDAAKVTVDRAHRDLPRRVSRTAFVSSEGLTHTGDEIHFDAASARELGRRYARAYQELVAAAPSAPGRAPADASVGAR